MKKAKRKEAARKAAGKGAKAEPVSRKSARRRASQIVFEKFDTDGGGTLSSDEVFKMLRTFLRQSFTVDRRAFSHVYREMSGDAGLGVDLERFHDFIMSPAHDLRSPAKGHRSMNLRPKEMTSATADLRRLLI
jgi:hypothetical protein